MGEMIDPGPGNRDPLGELNPCGRRILRQVGRSVSEVRTAVMWLKIGTSDRL
jgi:hypothetical protein